MSVPATVIRYIDSVSRGAGTGADWANAAPLSDLNHQCGLAGPDGEVWLNAGATFYAPGAGGYVASLTTQVGTAGHPVKILGRYKDGRIGYAKIKSSRLTPYLGGTSAIGKAGISIKVHHVTVDHLKFENMGDGCVTFNTDVQLAGITLNALRGKNVRRFIWQKKDDTSNILGGLLNPVMRDIRCTGFSKICVRFEGNTTGLLFEDFMLDGDYQRGDSFSAGIAFLGTVAGKDNTNNTVRMGVIRNIGDYKSDAPLVTNTAANDKIGDDYWNGDGISSETGDLNLTIEDVYVENISDGGFDCKGTTTYRRCTAYRCKRSWRNWNLGNKLIECTSIDPYSQGGTGYAARAMSGTTVTVTDGVTTAGSRVVTSATAAFTSADLYKVISGGTIPSGSIIASVQSPTQATFTNTTATAPTAPVGAGSATADATGVTITRYTLEVDPAFASGAMHFWSERGGIRYINCTAIQSPDNMAAVFQIDASNDNGLPVYAEDCRFVQPAAAIFAYDGAAGHVVERDCRHEVNG